jgi:excisionase family DNA binding protein
VAIQRDYLSPNEIAEYLGVSPFTIRRYIKLGELRAVKLLGSFRVHRADLQAFLEAHQVNPAEEQLEVDESDEHETVTAGSTPLAGAAAVAASRSPVRPIPIPETPARRGRGRPRKNPES